MTTPIERDARGGRRRSAALVSLTALALLSSACGSRLTGRQAALAEGTAFGGIGAPDASTAQATGSSATTSTTLATTQNTAGSGASSTGPSAAPSDANTGGGAAAGGAAAASGGASGPCGPNGNQAPAGGNGGATATGVTATTINIANIASIGGVSPGVTQGAQQGAEAWAAYVNSTGGICGRQITVQPFDDDSDSGNNYADAQQACSADFALVGSASGFDDGGAQAVTACGIPDLEAVVTTPTAGNTPDIFGAAPGDAHYFPLGAAEYLKATYPSATQHAAMIYLDIPATSLEGEEQVAAYQSVGWHFVYNTSTTPINANYATNVQAMQSAGAQYVTEISDAPSAERLMTAMQQADFNPQVVDWITEEYSPQFVQQTEPESNGDLVLMNATADFGEASSNPEMQLMENWLERVTPGYQQSIFTILAWSAGLAFEQAAKEVGPDLTRAAILTKIQGITNWTGDGVTPPVNIGQKIPSKCFFYLKIENGGFQRVYPSAPNTYDCNGGYYRS